MEGLHLVADLLDCQCAPELLVNADSLGALCRTQTLAAGLGLVADKWHTFPNVNGQAGGITGMLLLAESHVAVHTWPEQLGVTLDVYVCNFSANNSTKAECLMAALIHTFAPRQAQCQRILRGNAAHHTKQ